MIKIVVDFNKKLGFTLAEILVTIGLLGSIAALTLPTLAYNYRGKVLEQQYRSTYSDIRSIAAVLNTKYGDWSTYVNGAGKGRWYSQFMAEINGGNQYRVNGVTNETITTELRNLYGSANSATGSGKYRFSISNGLKNGGEPCDNGGVWVDNKGRIWTFNHENGMICVDINGIAKPNRHNIDIFAFIPMSPEQLAIWVYNDAGNPDSYTGTIVPCNIELIQFKGAANNVPDRSVTVVDESNRSRPYEKGSGSALDYCPFNEPIENVAVVRSETCNDGYMGCGRSAKGKSVTTSNNYWKDYIDYK